MVEITSNFPRTLTTHHDGHGLNESLNIVCDDLDPAGGGASHGYRVLYESAPDDAGNILACRVASIQFQHGPRNVEGSTVGVTEAVLYAILIDRMEAFQAGPFACPENDIQLHLLCECLALTKERADKRAARGVLGQNLK